MSENYKHHRKFLSLLLMTGAAIPVIALPSLTGHGQAITLPTTVVTATRITTPIEEVGSSVTVITAEDMRRRQHNSVHEALSIVPGLRVVQLGGPGRVTSVFARGANSNQTLVLIDGLEAMDPSSANGAFNFAHLTVDNIERIEVVRGPQSTLYGSDAIGTVINIISKKGGGKRRNGLGMEVGSHASFKPMATASGALGRVNYATSLSFFTTGGETVTSDAVRPVSADKEKDAHENLSASLRLGVDITDDIETDVIARYIHTDTDTDVTAEDPDSQSISNQYFVRWQAKGSFFDRIWNPTIAINFTRFVRESSNDPDSLAATQSRATDAGTKYKTELQNDFQLGESHTVTLGIEAEKDKLHSTSDTNFPQFAFRIIGSSDAEVQNNAVYLQDQFHLYNRLSGTIGVRHDDHETFGGETTFRITPIYFHKETGTRIKASYGTGFRAPALFELFGSTANNFGGTFNGNPNLNPEKSRGWEAGLEQDLHNGRIKLGAVYFHNKIKNLIVCGVTTCTNTSDAKTRGIESFVSYEVNDWLELRADHTFLRAENAAAKTDLLRRPRHKADMEVVVRPDERSNVTLAASFIGQHKDVSFTSGTTIDRGSYTVFRLAGSFKFSDGLELFGRIENLFDRDYEVANGFKGPGIEGFIGVRSQF